uniref:Uncharacterized protein n=1 Tax=Arion vulgaris TaxID=1028688 RepID=A0A0B7AU48_9EUPU
MTSYLDAILKYLTVNKYNEKDTWQLILQTGNKKTGNVTSNMILSFKAELRTSCRRHETQQMLG